MAKVTALTLAVAERKQQALYFRTLGLNYREIYEQMVRLYGADKLPGSYDERYVYRDIQEEVHRVKAELSETANQVRIIELQTLNQMQSAIMTRALSGDYKAIDKVLKIMNTRALLLGLNAPAQVNFTDWRSELIDLIKSGQITMDQVRMEYGDEIVRELTKPGSGEVIEGQVTETKAD